MRINLKKTFNVTLIVAGVGLVTFGMISLISSTDTNQRASVLDSDGGELVNKADFYLDTDGDGLRDWEEDIFGTDKNIQDTDGDGLGDKEEYELQFTDSVDGKAGPNQTDLLAGQIISSLLLAQQDGRLQEGAADLQVAIEKDIENLNNIPSVFDQSKFNPTSGSYKAASKYLVKTFEEFDEQGVGKEIHYMLRIYKANIDPEKYVAYQHSLKTIGERYIELAERILDTPCPENCSDDILAIANSAVKTGTALINYSKGVDDPLVSAFGFGQYRQYNEEFENNVENFVLMLKKKA